ncbi:MAG: ATP-binding protein [Clostridia bacterium]|nr:ATP-binding protein [Clostridia bacterium]
MDKGVLEGALMAQQQQGPDENVPAWLEESIQAAGLNGPLAATMRRAFLAAQRRQREILRNAACSSLAELEELQERERVQAALDAQVPRRLREASFACASLYPPAQAAFEWVSQQIEGWQGSSEDDEPRPLYRFRGGCLVLAGPTGVGKSWAAVAAVREFVRAYASFRWCYAPDMLPEIDSEMHREHVPLRQTSAATTQVLVIDDLGAEAETKSERERIDRLIYHRHGNRLTTIITTNLSVPDLRERYGDRVADRLYEWGVIHEFGGASQRMPEIGELKLAKAAGYTGGGRR